MCASGACETCPAPKILMTADAVGGVWQYSVDLIAHLATRGAQVLLATMGPRPDAAKKSRLAEVPGVTLCENDYKLEWMDRPWIDVDAAGDWLLELAHQFQPDIIHLNGYAHAALPWQAPVVVVAHSCVYSWWQAVHNRKPPQPEWSEYCTRVSAGLRAADLVISPSASMAASLSENYGIPTERIKVIHNFSESPIYSGSPKEPGYLSAGRAWDVAKNLQMLDDIGAGLPWPVRIAGALPHHALITQMHQASIYVHPALYEPFGLAILEAARAQCCLILADIPSLRELWDGVAAFVNPHDRKAWIETLTRLAEDRTERERLGQLARSRADRYTASRSIGQYFSAYTLLIESRRDARKGVAA